MSRTSVQETEEAELEEDVEETVPAQPAAAIDVAGATPEPESRRQWYAARARETMSGAVDRARWSAPSFLTPIIVLLAIGVIVLAIYVVDTRSDVRNVGSSLTTEVSRLDGELASKTDTTRVGQLEGSVNQMAQAVTSLSQAVIKNAERTRVAAETANKAVRVTSSLRHALDTAVSASAAALEATERRFTTRANNVDKEVAKAISAAKAAQNIAGTASARLDSVETDMSGLRDALAKYEAQKVASAAKSRRKSRWD